MSEKGQEQEEAPQAQEVAENTHNPSLDLEDDGGEWDFNLEGNDEVQTLASLDENVASSSAPDHELDTPSVARVDADVAIVRRDRLDEDDLEQQVENRPSVLPKDPKGAMQEEKGPIDHEIVPPDTHETEGITPDLDAQEQEGEEASSVVITEESEAKGLSERDEAWEEVFQSINTIQEGFTRLSEALLKLNEQDYRD